MKKITFVLGFVLIVSQISFSQNDITINAFEKSYEYEYLLNYKDAITKINEIYTPDDYATNLRLGWLYYLDGDFIKSQTYYKKAMSISENSIEARLGYIYPTSKLENWNEVMQAYIDILKIDPNNTLAMYWLSYMYYLRNDFKKAEVLIKRNILLYPFDFDSNYLASNIYVSLGDIVTAKKYILQALMINPSSENAKELLGKIQ